MTPLSFAQHLAAYGPTAPSAPVMSLADAQAYCRAFAAGHYENFTVASWLLPRRLRQHFANIYSYCRWADDLADETGSATESLLLLDWWEAELHACYAGQTRHPVFVALAETIRTFDIPRAPWLALLTAFRQDQTITRYATHADVLGYCQNSANPVGQLILHLAGAADEPRIALSNHVCTGLQLANFCQDLANDWERGRIYLPLDACARHGVSETDFVAQAATRGFVHLLADQVNLAEAYLQRGLALVPLVPGWLQVDVELFIRGGLRILQRTREIGYDVWTMRPRVSKADQLRLLVQCWWSSWFPRLRREAI